MLTGRKALALTSQKPGKTTLINHFLINGEWYLVDLPGYGYAKVPVAVRDQWRGMVDGFLRSRQALKGLVLIMDSRHPLKEYDCQMLEYARAIGKPCHVLLTKADKLSRNEAARTLMEVKKALAVDEAQSAVSVQLFSATAKTGLDEARAVVARWLGLPEQAQSPASASLVRPRGGPISAD